MLREMFPRIHGRLAALWVLGPLLDEFAGWLHARGFPRLPIRLRVRAAPRLAARLRRRGIRDIAEVSRAELLAFAPRDAAADMYLAALVHSLARFLTERGRLKPSPASAAEQLVAAYSVHLARVRGLATSTIVSHQRTALELLSFVGFARAGDLHNLGARRLEDFVRRTGERIGRESLQHTIAHLRSFLRFLDARGEVPHRLPSSIDTPRVIGASGSRARCPGRR
jgi:hypothetical protein